MMKKLSNLELGMSRKKPYCWGAVRASKILHRSIQAKKVSLDDPNKKRISDDDKLRYIASPTMH